ncbi:MAG: hypothetical protein LQ342_006575 [Letrouitia transgressa]|nr:MAG: hypothetical protein LQ342_006575 [Letrouitia transgressa]
MGSLGPLEEDLIRPAVSESNGTTGKVCNWVEGIQLQQIPAAVKERAKLLILDGIACAIVGAKLPWSRLATDTISKVEGSGSCTVIGWDKSMSPLNSALLNGSFIQGFELDDVHVDAPWHANSVILPALFAAAELWQQEQPSTTKISGASFLLSTIVGFEIGSRVGRALHGSEMLSRGWHSGAVFGPPAAAAAVSKLLDLSPGQIEDAFGTACTQACGLMSAQYESMGKRMQHGFASRNGLFAALMSKEGYTGIDQVFERPYGGYLDTFGQGSQHSEPYLENELTHGLGKDWRGIEGIRIKNYNSMIATHAPIECIAALQAEHPSRFASLDTIAEIEIEQAKAPHAHGGQLIERPVTATGAQMSSSYIVAVQLLDRDVLLEPFRETNLERDDIWNLIAKTKCKWQPQFDEISAWYTRVSVTFSDGYIVRKEIPVSKTMASLLSEDEIRQKWATLTDKVIDAKTRSRLEYAILHLEEVADVVDMLQLLKGEVGAALE